MTVLSTITAVDLLGEPEPIYDHLAGDLIPAVGLFLLAGDPKSFKTMLAVQLAISVASPSVRDFLGKPIRHGPVLFVEEEGSRRKLGERIRMMCRGLGIEPPQDLYLLLHSGVRLDDRVSAQSVYDTAQRIRPVLIVLDPLVMLHSGDENKAGEMSRVMRVPVHIATRLECAVVLVHHLNKPSIERQPKRLAQRLRGSSAFAGATDGTLLLDRDDGALTVRVRGEYRDAEPVDLYLELDTANLLLSETEPPESARKVKQADLLVYVQEQGNVGVRAVSERFGITRNTARTVLEMAVASGHLDTADAGKNRGAIYFLKVVNEPNDHLLTTDHGGSRGGQSVTPIGGALTTDHLDQNALTTALTTSGQVA